MGHRSDRSRPDILITDGTSAVDGPFSKSFRAAPNPFIIKEIPATPNSRTRTEKSPPTIFCITLFKSMVFGMRLIEEPTDRLGSSVQSASVCRKRASPVVEPSQDSADRILKLAEFVVPVVLGSTMAAKARPLTMSH